MQIRKKRLDYILSIVCVLLASLTIFCTPEEAVVITLSAIPNPAELDQQITFNVSFQGLAIPPGATITYFWDFDGDGTTDDTTQISTTTYSYSEQGTYDASVTIVLGAYL